MITTRSYFCILPSVHTLVQPDLSGKVGKAQSAHYRTDSPITPKTQNAHSSYVLYLTPAGRVISTCIHPFLEAHKCYFEAQTQGLQVRGWVLIYI